MKAQSNPVLFIFLGQTVPLLDPFRDILEGYGLEGAAFIAMKEHPYDEWIKDEVNRIHQGFINYSYDSSGIIRINYLLSGDDWNLSGLRYTVEKYVGMLYPLDIYTDIYWLLDDASALDGRTPSRIRTMEMLRDMLTNDTNKAQIYLMSNLDSNNVFIPQDEILRTIALLSLFKDYEPKEYPVEPGASRYNEFKFMENAANLQKSREGAGFLTAGCRSLQVPIKALKGYLVNVLLEWGKANTDGTGKTGKTDRIGKTDKTDKTDGIDVANKINENENPNHFNITNFIRGEYVLFSKIVDREYIYGMAIPEINSPDYKGLSRKTIIKRLFGNRLDSIMHIYLKESIRLPAMDLLSQAMEKMPFYKALAILGDKGKWRTAVLESLTETNAAINTAQEDFNRWLDVEHNIKEGGRRKLSIWVRPENWPYLLAEEYVEQLFRLGALEALKDHLMQSITLITDYHETLSQYLQVLEGAKEALAWDKLSLDSSFDIFVPNVSDYYLKLYQEYERSHYNILETLTMPMARHLKEGTFTDYLAHLAEFVETTLIPALERPFTDMLQYLEKECAGRMPVQLAEWAIRTRRFNIQLKIGYVGLYAEANILMPSIDATRVKASYDSQGLGRLNLFIDSQADRIDILHQAGVFDLDDLYYKDLYI